MLSANILFILIGALWNVAGAPLPFGMGAICKDFSEWAWLPVFGISCLILQFPGRLERGSGLFYLMIGYCTYQLYKGILYYILGKEPAIPFVAILMCLILAGGVVAAVFFLFYHRVTTESVVTLVKQHWLELLFFFGLIVVLLILSNIKNSVTYALLVQVEAVTSVEDILTSGRLLGNLNILVEVAISAVVLLALYCMLQYGEQDLNYIISMQLYEQERNQYQQFRQNVEYINSRYHDLKHCLRLLSKDRDSAERLLRDMGENITVLKTEVDTGNETLNTIITDRQMLCCQKGIELHFMSDGTDFSWIDPIDLYILFCNILDNAIEFLEHIEGERTIKLGIKTQEQIVLIHSENSLAEQLKMDGEFPVSTKGEAKDHGFGLKSIERIAKKYGGNIRLITDGGRFSLNVLLQKSEI